ncbi:hypothetical protein SBD_5387 [Streptomyces bottropensis ATCC 25435]|uniref:Uncharacterized protein n=1 Tax=Streptomyces bottropensis ATCC 25435 TaxID=1054862 RepID=M3DBW3_9ACTN|nr:hypothetical protein SBD_5387 [Streptomyces bottropensis ATCC 25435]
MVPVRVLHVTNLQRGRTGMRSALSVAAGPGYVAAPFGRFGHARGRPEERAARPRLPVSPCGTPAG